MPAETQTQGVHPAPTLNLRNRISRSAEQTPLRNAICLLCSLAAAEYLWAYFAGIKLVQMHESALLIAGPLFIGLLLDALGLGERIALGMCSLGLWMGWLLLGSILSYLAATLGFGLLDFELARIDSALGFDWASWFQVVEATPRLKGILSLAYSSMFPQIILAIIFFAHPRRAVAAMELWWTTMLAVIFTCLLSGVMPALGTYAYYNVHPDLGVHLEDLHALREGRMTIFPSLVLRGIITFPSFHAAIAVLLCYPYRGFKWLFRAACILNFIMLISVPSQGGHYLADVIGGVAVAALSIGLYRLGRRFTRNT